MVYFIDTPFSLVNKSANICLWYNDMTLS